MLEYLIGYVGAEDPGAPCVVEEREWPDRAAMETALAAEGWEVHDEAPHRGAGRRIIFRRAIAEAAAPPRHLIPCW